MHKKGLGKGLGALISSENNDDNEKMISEIRLNDIEPNTNQPRKKFDDEKIITLADSIKIHGVVQPIIVKKEGSIYRIIAGERRWRAARIAGLSTIPVVIKDITDKQVMEIALIENIQREDLNPIEEAEAYERLFKEYEMTQEELSSALGKSRSAIANSMRLLMLPELLKNYVINGELTSGHARAILSIENDDERIKAAEEVISKNLNVRETEKLVKGYLTDKKKVKEKSKNEQYLDIEEKLQAAFGTKVKLIANKKKGKIMIEYYSSDELERIIEMVCKNQ